VVKAEGNKPLERPRRRWMDNIKMDLGEPGWRGVDWFDFVQERDRRASVLTVLFPDFENPWEA
jgi:hypothetical protein